MQSTDTVDTVSPGSGEEEERQQQQGIDCRKHDEESKSTKTTKSVSFAVPLEKEEQEGEGKSPLAKANTPTAATTATKGLSLSDEVHVDSLEQYLMFSVEKVVSVRGLSIHLLLLILITVSVLCAKISPHASLVSDVLLDKVFDRPRTLELTSLLDVATYLNDTISRVFDHELALGFTEEQFGAYLAAKHGIATNTTSSGSSSWESFAATIAHNASLYPSISDVNSDIDAARLLLHNATALQDASIGYDFAFVGIVSLRVHRGEINEPGYCEPLQTDATAAFVPSEEGVGVRSVNRTADGSPEFGTTTELVHCTSESVEQVYDHLRSAAPLRFAGLDFDGRAFLRGSYSPVSFQSTHNLLDIDLPLVESQREEVLANVSRHILARPGSVDKDSNVDETSELADNVRAVIMETLVLHVPSSSITHVTFVYENLASNKLSAVETFPFTFQSYSASTGHLILFIVDLTVLLVLVPGFVYDIGMDVYLRRKKLFGADASWLAVIGWWQLFNAAFVVVLGSMMGFKLYMWVKAEDILDTSSNGSSGDATTIISNTRMFEMLISYSITVEVALAGLAWTAMLAYLRTFMYLRFSFRLSIINETIGSSVHEMIGVWLIFLMVFVTYGWAGVVMWGHTRPQEFASLYKGITFLFVMLLNGEADTYDKFNESDLVSAKLYFMSFFLLSWFILLNVVVGVLALSFASVTETLMMMRRAEWTPRALARDCLIVLKRMNPIHWCCSGTMSQFVQDRLALLDALRRWKAQGIENTISGPSYMSLKTLLRYSKHDFEPAFVRHVFQKSVQQVGTENARLRQIRMTDRAINNGLGITRRLEKQATMIANLHRKVCVQKSTDAAVALNTVVSTSPEYMVIRSEVSDIATRVLDHTDFRTMEARLVQALGAKLRRVKALVRNVVALLENGRGASPRLRTPSSPLASAAAAASAAVGVGVASPQEARKGMEQRQQRSSSSRVRALSTSSSTSPQQQGPPGPVAATRAFKLLLRRLSTEEANARFELQAALLDEQQIAVLYCVSARDVLVGESGGWRSLLAAFCEKRDAITAEQQRRQREHDDAIRQHTLEEYNRKLEEAKSGRDLQKQQQRQAECKDEGDSASSPQQPKSKEAPTAATTTTTTAATTMPTRVTKLPSRAREDHGGTAAAAALSASPVRPDEQQQQDQEEQHHRIDDKTPDEDLLLMQQQISESLAAGEPNNGTTKQEGAEHSSTTITTEPYGTSYEQPQQQQQPVLRNPLVAARRATGPIIDDDHVELHLSYRDDGLFVGRPPLSGLERILLSRHQPQQQTTTAAASRSPNGYASPSPPSASLLSHSPSGNTAAIPLRRASPYAVVSAKGRESQQQQGNRRSGSPPPKRDQGDP